MKIQTMINEENIIKISHLNFAYNKEIILENISLTVKKGDFLGLIGPNGGGKTTLLRLILGFLPVTQGEIFLFDQKITHFNNWQRIGYVAQQAGFNATGFPITVEEVMAMAGAKKIDIDQTLALTNVLDKKKKLLSELSGGQRQRVFIARALLHKPELLILDEPTVGIDSRSRTNFYELLRNLNREDNLTLILVSHEIDLIAKEVNKVACINKNLIYHDHPKELLEDNWLEKLYGKNHRLIAHHH